MSLTPLNINVLGEFVQNSGLRIEQTAFLYAGVSSSDSDYTSGRMISSSGVDFLSRAINIAYNNIGASPGDVSQSIYDQLITIGQNTIPALGACPPSTYTRTYTGSTTQWGFYRLFAKQQHDEFHPGDGTYAEFIQTFSTCFGLASHRNSAISAVNSASSYLLGTYSNMNDLITSDIAGVSLSMTVWGTDLIASGKVIDLHNIDKFGNPDVLLRTIYNRRAMSNALNLMLLSTGIPTTEILNICAGQPATDEQQRLLYAAFTLIVQKDLEEILIPLNCQTKGLFTLADLLDPKKLFPNSYQTLTFPIYNSDSTGPTNSKTYYLIYKDDAPANIDTYDLGARLRAYLPNDLAFVCAAFRITMMQIKNIHSMDIEKFSQVVTHLEPISDLNVGGTNVPTDITTANIAKSYVAMGTNSDGTYSMCDFFGCITSLHYDWITIRELILATESPALASIYQQMFYLLDGDGPFNTQLQTLIDNANTELDYILANSETVTELNTLYAEFGHLLDREQTAREGVLRDTENLKGNVNDIIGFLQNIGTYAQSTEEKGPALVLEDIADLNTLGGNSLIASMREARNALKLGLTGAMLENIVNNDALVLPPITGTMSSLGLPIVTGAPIVPGSLAGSPETTLIPPNLSIFNTPSNTKAVIFPDAAVSQVITCNCDCWLP